MLGPNDIQFREIEKFLNQTREELLRIALQWKTTPLGDLKELAGQINPIVDWCQRQRIAVETERQRT